MSLYRVIAAAAALVTIGAGTAVAQDAAAGAKVYADQKCSLCHSIAGKGNAKGSLDGVGTTVVGTPAHAAPAVSDRHGGARRLDVVHDRRTGRGRGFQSPARAAVAIAVQGRRLDAQ